MSVKITVAHDVSADKFKRIARYLGGSGLYDPDWRDVDFVLEYAESTCVGENSHRGMQLLTNINGIIGRHYETR